eukprot:TRINITY_DN30215_c0_g1_i2.p1 TRINITY_DN30215_c0_g1~~TRINITY_DN30215_c0_g1_i2.p1  ORF type:complete len:588 (+),score=97.87 TRINITY_DN30215_c0_g1_i2:63-1766(+)
MAPDYRESADLGSSSDAESGSSDSESSGDQRPSIFSRLLCRPQQHPKPEDSGSGSSDDEVCLDSNTPGLSLGAVPPEAALGGDGDLTQPGAAAATELRPEATDPRQLLPVDGRPEGRNQVKRRTRSAIILDDSDAAEADGLNAAGAAATSAVAHWLRLPKAPPNVPYDLRRFIRPGDVLNYIGGNIWGHVVMILSTPMAVLMPVLYEAPPPAKEAPTPSSARNRPQAHMCARLEPVVLGYDVPVYLFEVLQSASNMEGIGSTTCALAVHPMTHEICAVKGQRHGAQICGTSAKPITADIYLSPLNNDNIDMRVLHLAVSDTVMVPQDTKWSFRTAVRSYLRHAKVHSWTHATKRSRKRLAKDICKAWKVRPVCSTVPPRVWQKYLLKMSYKRSFEGQGVSGGLPPEVTECFEPVGGSSCAPLCGPTGIICESSDSKHAGYEENPEIAWATDVLRMMPVRDDRVLPSELVKILMGTGYWTLLDVDELPQHRANDNLRAHLDKRLRAKLPPGMKNKDDVDCWIGYNGGLPREATGGEAALEWRLRPLCRPAVRRLPLARGATNRLRTGS